MSPQLSTRRLEMDMSTRDQRAKRNPLRSNATVVPEWAQQVHETRGAEDVGKGPRHG